MLLSGDCSSGSRLGLPVLLRTSSSNIALYSPTMMVYFPDATYGDYLAVGFAMVFLVLAAAQVVFHFIGIFYVKLCMYHKPSNVLREEMPGVSILKPLCGVDANLPCNLESYFLLSYPRFELLICIQDEDDEAIKVVTPLVEKYPHVDATVFIGGSEFWIHQKVIYSET
ncbi:ceramide glucosyltransferase-like [Lytechinus variegatus]|uniref:ceramide glucosyltransferase-like n=1 Tax=Lytechinus variegatus TaxID=7654 RepID=UPI001BB11A31|nr:ceramide glucosyltransferase-like [Lytechinus variegatus]